MKNFRIVFTLLILISCSERNSTSESDLDFLLSQDTVMIDPKGSIINLKYGLTNPELSKDGKYLYHYTHGEAMFDKINLENLELEKTLKFEKEGPNGMGGYIGGYTLTSDDKLMIWSYGLDAVFDQEGTKLKDLGLTKIAPELKGPEAFPFRLMEHPNDPNTVFGLYGFNQLNQFLLARFDLENETYEKIALPETEKLENYQMEIEQGGRPAGGFSPKPMATKIQDNKIVLTNGAYNEGYVYDILLDSLYLISWDSKLTGNQNEYKLPKTVELEQAEEHRRKFKESINFLDPQWDPISERYIRLSFKSKFSPDLDEYGDAEEIGAEVFLTVLDRDLNIIKETYLENYQKNPRKHFFLDSKVWLYENMDDELGFVRITVD